MNLLIVDDHPLFRRGLQGVLHAMDATAGIEEASDLEEALQKAGASRCDLVLLDLKLPGLQGLPALERLRDRLPDIPVVVISGESFPALVRGAIEGGAAGFIPKTLAPEALVEALRRVLAGKIFLPEDVLAGIPSEASSLPELTARQMEVLHGAIQGKSNKSIARDLDVSSETVKSHLSAAMRALGARNRTELVYIAARRGLQIG